MWFKKVKLRKDIDYVYCFLKDKIIHEEECDNYKHNLECDRNNDFWGRTHRKGSDSGRRYAYHGTKPILNSCNYCLNKAETLEEFYLPEEATKNKKKRFFGLF